MTEHHICDCHFSAVAKMWRTYPPQRIHIHMRTKTPTFSTVPASAADPRGLDSAAVAVPAQTALAVPRAAAGWRQGTAAGRENLLAHHQFHCPRRVWATLLFRAHSCFHCIASTSLPSSLAAKALCVVNLWGCIIIAFLSTTLIFRVYGRCDWIVRALLSSSIAAKAPCDISSVDA